MYAIGMDLRSCVHLPIGSVMDNVCYICRKGHFWLPRSLVTSRTHRTGPRPHVSSFVSLYTSQVWENHRSVCVCDVFGIMIVIVIIIVSLQGSTIIMVYFKHMKHSVNNAHYKRIAQSQETCGPPTTSLRPAGFNCKRGKCVFSIRLHI